MYILHCSSVIFIIMACFLLQLSLTSGSGAVVRQFIIKHPGINSCSWNKYPCRFIKHNIIIKVKKNTARNTTY